MQAQESESEDRFIVPQMRLFLDCEDAVLDDKWMFIVIWGEQRTGKSTLALWITYFLWRMLNPDLSESELWERVYDSLVFNLGQLIYKLRSPRAHRIWDMKHLHNRVPIILWDDFGGHSNKAVTQHEIAWDHFKGGFDVLGTKLAILVITLADPREPTNQIEHKYTHEIRIVDRGIYKYDKVTWQQDFRGWSPMFSKLWKEEQAFNEIPMKRYLEYDQMRMTLADEILVNIEDAMAQKIPWIIKRCQPIDFTALQRIVERGALMYDSIREVAPTLEQGSDMITRLKARQLIIPERRGSHTWYDITNLGLEVLSQFNSNSRIDNNA